MNTVRRQYKRRILLAWLLAAVGGYGLTAWFYLTHSQLTLGYVLEGIGLMGALATVVLYLLISRLVIPSSARTRARQMPPRDADPWILGEDENSDNLFLRGEYSPSLGANSTGFDDP